MQGSAGLGSGKESNGKSSEVALGSIHPTRSAPQAVPSSAGLLLLPEKVMPGATKRLFSSAGWSPPARGLMVKSHLRDTYRTMVLGEGKQEQHQKAEATQ